MSPSLPNNQVRNDNPAGRVRGADIVGPVALVVAHPGHELMAFGWLATLQPLVFVVTDGSGRDAGPRIEATDVLLGRGLGTRASVFGRWTDRELYGALFEGRFDPFLELFEELVDTWCSLGVQTAICDAYECRILMHDVVQIVASAAVAACRGRGAEVDLLEMPIYLGPGDVRPGNPQEAASFTAFDETLKRKIRAAKAYESTAVRQEVDEFLRLRRAEAFRVETLYHSIRRTPGELGMEPQPAWEAHGERLMEQGVYDRVIRLQDHIVPLARALDRPSGLTDSAQSVNR